MTIAIASAAGAVALWVMVRYVVLALIYGRRVVITSAVGAKLVAATALVVAMVSLHPAIIVAVGGVAVVAVTAIYIAKPWVVFGATTEYILDRAEFVARGLLMKYRRTGRGLVTEPSGDASISVLAALWGAHILRVTTTSDSKKSLLFSQGLVKFIGAKD